MQAMNATKGLRAAVLKCFNNGGDCKVIVLEKGIDGYPESFRRAEFTVWSKLLSSWSDVFRAMFTHDCSERQSMQVTITDFSASAVEAFLTYLHSELLYAGSANLIEIGALADKYAVQELQEVCIKRFEKELTPENACACLLVADNLNAETIKARCLELIFRSPQEALAKGFVLNEKLRDDILSSTMLCMGDNAIVLMLLEWAKSPVAKANGLEVGDLLEKYVQFGPLTEEEYSKIHSLAEPLGLKGTVEAMWAKQKRGSYTADFFKFLSDRHLQSCSATDESRSAFLGYWVNIIPSKQCFCRKWISCDGKSNSDTNQHSPAGSLEGMARNADPIVLEENDDVMFLTPHHSIAVKGVSFRSALGSSSHVQLHGSRDGGDWKLMFDSGITPDANDKGGAAIGCHSDQPLSWFRLCVRKGKYNNHLMIEGVVQPNGSF
eukprot:CAMPEP_0197889626 /NCGR_PEP_ID=MMETSP1439-20131203/24436_1 /TAXON_ID=66791 /ORGANISM="Gonyaulax spinifera, Strain CCMP409" /LENGTH=435 /DNA_ID=CAMNT_0043509611 /DNA_START=83 /DNA_END=1390 /DNA_ORIENTATION=-